MMNRYDALGMELTSDYSKRVSLFSVRVVFQFIGYAVPNAVGLVLSNIFPTNIIAVYAYTALVLGATSLAGLLLSPVGLSFLVRRGVGVVSLAALLVLGFGVSERPEAKTGQGNEVPSSLAVRGHRPFHLHHSSHWLRCPPWWLCGARCATGRTASTSSSSPRALPSPPCCPRQHGAFTAAGDWQVPHLPRLAAARQPDELLPSLRHVTTEGRASSHLPL